MIFVKVITLTFIILITKSYTSPLYASSLYASSLKKQQAEKIKQQILSLKENRKVNLHRAIKRYTKEYRLPSEELFAALLIAESNLNPCAISRVGAAGLSQLMPLTAENIGVTDRFDVHQSLWGGASVLRNSLNLTNGNITQSLGLYNWGSKSLKTPFKYWPRETRNYVKKITRSQKKFKKSNWENHVPRYIAYKNGKLCNTSQKARNNR